MKEDCYGLDTRSFKGCYSITFFCLNSATCWCTQSKFYLVKHKGSPTWTQGAITQSKETDLHKAYITILFQ